VLLEQAQGRSGGKHCCACICDLVFGQRSAIMSAVMAHRCVSKEGLTDLATGEVDNDVGWNLNTPFAFSVMTLPPLPALSNDIGLY